MINRAKENETSSKSTRLREPVLLTGSATHPRNCVVLETQAEEAIRRNALQKCIRLASTMPARLGAQAWADITAHPPGG